MHMSCTGTCIVADMCWQEDEHCWQQELSPRSYHLTKLGTAYFSFKASFLCSCRLALVIGQPFHKASDGLANIARESSCSRLDRVPADKACTCCHQMQYIYYVVNGFSLQNGLRSEAAAFLIGTTGQFQTLAQLTCRLLMLLKLAQGLCHSC